MKQFLKVMTILLITLLVGCNEVEEPVDEESVSIQFVLGDGTLYLQPEIRVGFTVVFPTTEKEGATLIGWSLSEDGELITEPYTVTEDVTFYSVWAYNMYTIRYESNGGTVLSEQILGYNTPITHHSVPEKEGYIFRGWYTDESLTTEFNLDTMPAYDVTLYAKWEINQYDITYNSNGGNILPVDRYDYMESIEAPEEPFQNGYLFIGWYLEDELLNEFTFNTMPAEDIELFAKWELIDFSDIDIYLTNLIPTETSSSILLPTAFGDYTISWQSSHPNVINTIGAYDNNHNESVVTLTATIHKGLHEITRTYNVNVSGTEKKSLSGPIASSYIYTNYSKVTDEFFDTLDIINCSFITAHSDGSLTGTSVLSNINTYIMPKAREHGNWVLFSVAPDSDWSDIVLSENTMSTFADNIVNMINQYGFDGVDIDWETPTTAEAEKFTDLMEIVYTKVKANNPDHLVTAAIAGGMWQPPKYDLVHSHQYIDYINMMTYSMVNNNGYYQNALYQSTSFDDASNEVGKTLTSCSIEESIAVYNSYGIPNSKIIVGVPFYATVQTRTYSNGSWSSWSSDGWLSYTSINSSYLNNSNYIYRYDLDAGVPYLLSTDNTTFITFDNPTSILEKSQYIIDQGLGGMMYWQDGHDLSGELLAAMKTGLNK